MIITETYQYVARIPENTFCIEWYNWSTFFQTIANIEYGKYQSEAYNDYLTQFEYERFEDETLSRQFALLQTLGTAAMSEEDQTSVT